MDLRDIEVPENSEFFIAIAKQGLHSFIMLGVVDEQNQRRLLARVGKTNDIDENFSKTLNVGTLKMVGKNLGKGTLARIADEGLSRRDDRTDSISYQAYSLTYTQTIECLQLIYELGQEQLNDSMITSRLQAISHQLSNPYIKCYIPIEEVEHGGQTRVVFKHQLLKDSEKDLNPTQNQKPPTQSIGMTKAISIKDTCRTTASNIIATILNFKVDPEISKYFFTSLRYDTKLKGGQPDPCSFYIMPPPPEAFVGLDSKQKATLKRLYERLKAIPLKCTQDVATREKFDALKQVYKDIAGTSSKDVASLLQIIVRSEQEKQSQLFKKRWTNVFCKTSTPETVFKKIKSELKPDEPESSNNKANSTPPNK